jgi:tetratricopeptide (TPR) repeat protein
VAAAAGTRLRVLAFALAVATALTACSTRLSSVPEDPRRELAGVPFFPQTIHQCGPAALATVLGSTGVAVTPDQLAPQVYIPGRRGSLQVEMLAAARSHGRLAYVLEPHLADVEAELAAGNPVLVLQDLGALGIRRWHFAVVIAFDTDRDLFVLRSGTERRRIESRQRFLRSWQTGGNWAAVITPPDRPPATATGGGFIRALTAAERYLPPQSVAAAHAAALARWPEDPLVLLANGNQAYAAGLLDEAIRHYRSLLAIEPGNVAGRNNLASALLDAGCVQAARAEAERAAALLETGSPLAAAVNDTLALATAATASGSSTCGAE